MERRAAWLATTLALAAGCGGSLARSDGGTGTGASGGSGAGGSGGTGAGGSTAGTGGATVSPEYQVQLDTAAGLWAAAKGSCAIYSYDRRFMSVFGFGASTEVEVQNDVATRRRYSTGAWRDGGTVFDGGAGWTIVWDEAGSGVGAHGSVGTVYPASTVEQLLAECAAVLARDPAAYLLTLQLDPARGVPLVCTNFPVNCFDDCESGIRIASFSCAPLAN